MHFENFNIHLRITDQSVSSYYTQKISSNPMNIRTESPIKHSLYKTVHCISMIQNCILSIKFFCDYEEYIQKLRTKLY